MNRAILPFTVFLCGCVSNPFPSNIQRQAPFDTARTLCEVSANTYFSALDQGDALRFANVFTEDAHLILPEAEFQGRQEIVNFVRNRPAEVSLTHHLTTFDYRPSGKDQARGKVYALISAQRRLNNGTVSQGIAERSYSDIYVVSVDSCKIARRELKTGTTHVTRPGSSLAGPNEHQD